uniref:ATP-dependent Clp protease proteolytic subunit n=1 Tax=Nephroselmis pyriformis TaxID=156128 RepID=A0A8A2H8F4_9CHLO|nr:proteolytic subunit 2 of clp protease [Nephroselmis pyriformis]QSV37303.1 proteolytic subunit 2 of clp protease [Nephroselmis pyriformis]
MPIGVPKVPFRIPGEATPQWVDLYNRLYRERILFLAQALEDELSNQLIGIMLYLNAEDDSQGLVMYINSPGGSVMCGISVYDTMHHVTAEVTTICLGLAASMASFVLAGGEMGQRIALPRSRVMIHQPEGGSQGQATEVFHEVDEVRRIRRQVGRIYAERTNQTLETIAQDMDRDRFLSAKEAKAYGLVDEVAAKSQWGGKVPS